MPEFLTKAFGIAFSAIELNADAQHQLGQVVAADGKPVETTGEFPGEQDVAGHLAHDQHFETLLASLQPAVAQMLGLYVTCDKGIK